MTIGIVLDPDHGKMEIQLERVLEEIAIPETGVKRSNVPDGRERWVVQFRLTGRHRREFRSELLLIPQVFAIER